MEALKSPDAHVENVRQKLLDRSRIGLAKYGVTTERKDLSLKDWILHLQQELMDAAVYAEAPSISPPNPQPRLPRPAQLIRVPRSQREIAPTSYLDDLFTPRPVHSAGCSARLVVGVEERAVRAHR